MCKGKRYLASISHHLACGSTWYRPCGQVPCWTTRASWCKRLIVTAIISTKHTHMHFFFMQFLSSNSVSSLYTHTRTHSHTHTHSHPHYLFQVFMKNLEGTLVQHKASALLLLLSKVCVYIHIHLHTYICVYMYSDGHIHVCNGCL